MNEGERILKAIDEINHILPEDKQIEKTFQAILFTASGGLGMFIVALVLQR